MTDKERLAYTFGQIYATALLMSEHAHGVEKLHGEYSRNPGRWIGPLIQAAYMGARNLHKLPRADLDLRLMALMNEIPAEGFIFRLDLPLQSALELGIAHEVREITGDTTAETA